MAVIRVGLSGGSGSGKSEANEVFRALGAPVVDADEIAHELTAPGRPELGEIAAAFGAGIINDDGALNRARLRQMIFSDDDARRRLNAILHPRIRRETERRVLALAADNAYCVICAPLLIEAGMTGLVDVVVIMDCDEETRVRRIVARDGVGAAQARSIIAAQAGAEQRLQAADIIIDNRAGREQLRQKIERLHRKLLENSALRGQDLIRRIR